MPLTIQRHGVQIVIADGDGLGGVASFSIRHAGDFGKGHAQLGAIGAEAGNVNLIDIYRLMIFK